MDSRIMSLAAAQAQSSDLFCELWDGTSPINGCDAATIRREYPTDGAVYLIKSRSTGQAVVIQHHAPGVDGHQPMTPGEAGEHSSRHLAQIRERIMAMPWEQLRAIREPLLTEADIKIDKATDSGVDPAPIRAYRQALRDLTLGLEDPAEVVWPAKPW